jgi:hypothetical protein
MVTYKKVKNTTTASSQSNKQEDGRRLVEENNEKIIRNAHISVEAIIWSSTDFPSHLHKKGK